MYWACLFLPPLVCPICQSLIFQLVSKVAIRVSRCMEGEEVTQPMCHTTQGRRQGVSPRLSHRGVSAWLSQRISARVSHRQAAGGVNRVRRMWLRLSLRWHLLLLHLYAATFHLYHTCCWVLVQTLSMRRCNWWSLLTAAPHCQMLSNSLNGSGRPLD